MIYESRWTLAPSGTPAARILEKLEEVVRKFHRRAALRRPFRSAGSAVTGLLSRIVPKTPPRYDLPPELFAPWF